MYIDRDDFDTTIFEVVFPADENQVALTDIDAFIPIVDDLIDEDYEQLFVVYIEVVSAVDLAKVENTERNISTCRIIDNDRKYIIYTVYMYICISTPHFDSYLAKF